MQAIIILAHKDFAHVTALTKLLTPYFKVLIHIDKQAHISPDEKKALIAAGAQCFSFRAVHWGAWSVAEVSLLMLKEALKNPEITYVHFISGQDWPLQDIRHISDFYEHTNKIYMPYDTANTVKKTGEPIIWWQKYYFNYDRLNRKTLFGKIFHRISLVVQTLLRVNKFERLEIHFPLYAGSQWVDLPRDAAEYLVNYMNTHPSVKKMFATGFCSDEFWMPTILVNSKFKDRIEQDNHRYIQFEKRNGSLPAILDMQDYIPISQGHYHFGRKFASPYSDQLIDKLDIK